MAKLEVTVTTGWQQIATGVATITILERAPVGGRILINESGVDLAANVISPSVGDQFIQNQDVPSFIRADNDGWRVLVDGAL